VRVGRHAHKRTHVSEGGEVRWREREGGRGWEGTGGKSGDGRQGGVTVAFKDDVSELIV
jgi:hypothetical protein